MLAVFGAVAFLGLLGMVMTTGDQVSQKIQMQNAVDAAALSGGAWIARGLNVTSAFNLIQTQLAGGAILLQGFDRALPIIQLIVGIQAVEYAACATTWPPCYLPLKATLGQLVFLHGFQPVIRAMTDLLANCEVGLFWTVAKALEWINGFVRETFVFLAMAEAHDVARANGAGVGLFVPGPFFHGSIKLSLPTEKKSFREHCEPMQFGSLHAHHRGYHPLVGYRMWEGPFTLGRKRLRWFPWVFGGVPSAPSVFVFDLYTERVKNETCEGGRCGSRRPELYRLNPARDGLSYLAVAHRKNRKIFFTGPWMESPPDFYTYAQVEIYNAVNGEHPDSYTQDWRARLAPASLLENSSALPAQPGTGTAVDGIAAFAQIHLESPQVEVESFLWQVGNH